MANQFQLLTQRRFSPFFWTQFLGAGNDNLFKFSLTLMVTFGVQTCLSADGSASATMFNVLGFDVSSAMIVQLIGVVFILPFIVLSGTSGQLCDYYEKSKVMRYVKNFEIALMGLAYYGFTQHNILILLFCTLGMGIHSTVFGPAKYAYLPQHLNTDELTGGNGMVEMGSFIAILLGTIMAGVLIDNPNIGIQGAGIACIVVAIMGRIAAQFIPNSPSSQHEHHTHHTPFKLNLNPFTETWHNLKLSYQNKMVFRCLLGISWLWFFGAVMLTQFPSLAKETLHGNPDVATFLLVVFSLGIGLGSLACEGLSHCRFIVIRRYLVSIGALGMSVFGIGLYYSSVHYAQLSPILLTTLSTCNHSVLTPLNEFIQLNTNNLFNYGVMINLFLLSFSAGLFSVPLYALTQTHSVESHRGRMVAANNIVNALFMIASAVMIMLLMKLFDCTVPQIILITAILNIAVVIYAIKHSNKTI